MSVPPGGDVGAGPLVVEVERSGLVESRYLVDVAVCDARGRLVGLAGDAQTVAYLRSSSKPVQATVCLEHGWSPATTEHLAIACASHNGEPAHVETARQILAAAGLDESALRCPPARPRVAESVPSPGAIYHNCSGKHAAMVATAAANGWPLDDYRVPGHPLQLAVQDRIEGLAGTAARAIGVDGCGVPTFAFTLAECARAFASFAAEQGPPRRAIEAMRAHPFLVAGTGRVCTAILGSVDDVVVKIGAEGILCGVLLSSDVAFALKVRDGAARATEVATVAVLELLGALPDPIPAALQPFASPTVQGGGAPVGALRCRGTLQRS